MVMPSLRRVKVSFSILSRRHLKRGIPRGLVLRGAGLALVESNKQPTPTARFRASPMGGQRTFGLWPADPAGQFSLRSGSLHSTNILETMDHVCVEAYFVQHHTHVDQI